MTFAVLVGGWVPKIASKRRWMQISGKERGEGESGQMQVDFHNIF